jgi:hypothetical protein
MQKVQEYRKRAKECRDLALKGPTQELRNHYTALSEIWDKLAEERMDYFIPKNLDEAG